MIKLQQILELAFPSFIIDIRWDREFTQHKITVFNANRFSSTEDPKKEEYLLTEEETKDPKTIIQKITNDFY